MALSHEDIGRFVARYLAPTIRRVNLMVSRAVVRRVSDSSLMQRVQLVLFGDADGEDVEVADEVEHVMPYGVSFVPPAGSEAVVLAVGGNRDNLVALGAVSRAHRPTGAAEGEGGLYSVEGWRVYLDRDGHVFIGDGPDGEFFEVALAEKVNERLDAIAEALDALAAAIPTPNDGGAALQAAFKAKWGAGTPPTPAADVGSKKVKVVA